MAEKSKTLIIGATGYIGKFIVEASASKSWISHLCFALLRESPVADPVKGKLIDSFKTSGALEQVDVVISTVSFPPLADQTKTIAAIKEAGNIKSQIRRAIEAEGIPYTYVVTGCFAGYFLPSFLQPGATAPRRDKVTILGDGTPKAIFSEEHDIGTYTIKYADDPRTCNKILYLKPPKNIYSFKEIVSLWEKNIGKEIEKIHVSEEQILKQIEESPIPVNILTAINHAVFVSGDTSNLEIEPSFAVEATELYPDVKYTTVEEYLYQFV